MDIHGNLSVVLKIRNFIYTQKIYFPANMMDYEFSCSPCYSRQVHPLGEKGPAPNICVQGGRIEFIKPNQDRNDAVKEKLEARIAELEAQLEEEKKSTLRERRNTARFQALIEDRESLARDVEVERGAREEVENKLILASQQVDKTRAKMHHLQDTCSRLEESLNAMSIYKSKYCQLKIENATLSKALETRMHQLQTTLNKLSLENEALKSQLHSLESAQGTQEEAVQERLRLAEEENSRLLVEREKCEKCLDQVAHQVVQALLSQKGLREEITSLRDKVKELEKQNYTLSTLLLQQIPSKQSVNKQKGHIEVCVRPVSCDEGRLKWRGEPLLWLPLHRPSSLNLETQRGLLPTTGGLIITGVECHKDEGYSTMSSEVQCEGSGSSNLTQGPLERLQEETNNRLADEDVVAGLLRSRPLIPRSSSDSALLAMYNGGSNLGIWDDQEWWDPDSTLSRIDFDAPPELDDWHMDDITGLSLLGEDMEDVWSSVLDNGQYSLTVSPGSDSWSSQTTSDGSKRSSGADSEAPPPGTHFTRDFYRLVKFESTKSLASTSSRSQMSDCGAGGNVGRAGSEIVLQLIAEKVIDQSQIGQNNIVEEELGITAGGGECEATVLTGALNGGLVPVPEEEEAGSEVVSLADLRRMTAAVPDEDEVVTGQVDPVHIDEGARQVESSHATGWVHLNTPHDINDPKTRASLVEVMMYSRSSSSCSGSSESGDDRSPYQHLHRLHRSRRHKKASATRDGGGAVRVHVTPRVSIIGREDIYTRFGAKEREALDSFDFLEEIQTSSRESTASRHHTSQ
ncbi:uncharacterized protein isoform X4 [Rhodnius prolixus]|uniref:uncharacterized protein isoform X4 n=1 Tax=Rhodnius prolixus TaxID=13249 RepID=UPI003D1881A8